MSPTEESYIRLLAREAATQAVNDEFKKEGLISAYVTSIAEEAADNSVQKAIRPLYKNPLFQNISAFLVAILAFFGITTFFSDIIRPRLQTYLLIDDTVSKALEKKQYEVYSGLFNIGRAALIEDTNPQICQDMNSALFVRTDVIVPPDRLESNVSSCFRDAGSATTEQGVPFVAEPGEEVFIEILLFGRRRPDISKMIAQQRDFKRSELLAIFAAGGDLVDGRTIGKELLSIHVDGHLIELSKVNNLISVPQPTSGNSTDYALFYGTHQFKELDGKFHNLSISIGPESGRTIDSQYSFRVFIERNRVKSPLLTAESEK